MKARFPYFALLILLVLPSLCACRPSPALPDIAPPVRPSLPAPQAHLTSQAAAAPPPQTAEAARIALPDSKAGVARGVYGGRLIEWVRIPSISVFAPVTAVGWEADGDEAAVWDSPHAQVGWALSSALPGEEGNIVLYGHNNIDSSVFRNLSDLRFGDEVRLQTGEGEWRYDVTEVNILPVQSEEEDRVVYAEYMSPSRAPRLTLISCWPPTNNTHRVIVVAYPAQLAP